MTAARTTLLAIAGATAVLTAAPHAAGARPITARDVIGQHGTVVSVPYEPDRETRLACAVGLACDVTLEPGETVGAGFAGAIAAWDPHRAYSGGSADSPGTHAETGRTPHLVFRAPRAAGVRTNAVVLTNRRTYHLVLVATADRDAIYYRFTFPRTIVDSAAAPRAVTAPAGPPAAPRALDARNPLATCFDFSYSYERGALPLDHASGATDAGGEIPRAWRPSVACTDGRHTYVQFPRTDVMPADTPVAAALGADGDAVVNSSYDELARRLTIDGVPDAFVLQLGAQRAPLRIVVRRAAHNDVPIGASR